MRFQSLRRSINGDLRKLPMSVGGTAHSSGPLKSAPLKARKTLVGLFDTPTRDDAEPSLPTNDPSSSPALSFLDLPAGSPFSSQRASHTHTLGSELGSEYGGDYAENHHLRSSSLYDVFLSGPSASRPATPTPMTPLNNSSNPLPDGPQSAKLCQDLEKTPQRKTHKADRPHRLSDTIRARTHYWVDKRYHFTTPVRRFASRHGPEFGNGSAEGQITAMKPAVAQAAVQTMTDAEERNLAVVSADTTGELQSTVAVTLLEQKKRGRVTRMVIELWLWVQFVIVILVFLWVITKRGPRSVLRNAERVMKRVE